MDRSVVLGILVALVAIASGFAIDGGSLTGILQPAAALIVIGGTLGAVLVEYPTRKVLGASTAVVRLLFPDRDKRTPQELASFLVTAARVAQQDGPLALEAVAEKARDPFLRRALQLASDGVDANTMQSLLALAMERQATQPASPAKVLETAGGYAPTVGIVGAVLGLIQVMDQLTNPSALGAGIAVAFVATLYGVGLANLVLLPLAGRLHHRQQRYLERCEMIRTAALGMADGSSPALVGQYLQSYLDDAAIEDLQQASVR